MKRVSSAPLRRGMNDRPVPQDAGCRRCLPGLLIDDAAPGQAALSGKGFLGR